MRSYALVLTAALAAPASPGSAAPITSLHSTGLGTAGSADPHYTLASAPAGSGLTAFVVADDGNFPFAGHWARNSYSPPGAPTSGWIGPTASANISGSHPAGEYKYRTTFDLSEFDPASAKITGFVAADNGVKVYLNDALVGSFYEKTGYTFTQTAFADQALLITSGFKPGVNTLDFVVTNEVQATGNPSGLRVALAGDAVPNPEPATLAVLGGGLIGLAGYIRRRRHAG